MNASLPFGPPINTDIDYYQVYYYYFFFFWLVMRCLRCMVCERREANACLIMLSAKQGSHWYHFYNVFGMTRPGIDPTPILTYRTRSGHSTT